MNIEMLVDEDDFRIIAFDKIGEVFNLMDAETAFGILANVVVCLLLNAEPPMEEHVKEQFLTVFNESIRLSLDLNSSQVKN